LKKSQNFCFFRKKAKKLAFILVFFKKPPKIWLFLEKSIFLAFLKKANIFGFFYKSEKSIFD